MLKNSFLKEHMGSLGEMPEEMKNLVKQLKLK